MVRPKHIVKEVSKVVGVGHVVVHVAQRDPEGLALIKIVIPSCILKLSMTPLFLATDDIKL